MHTDSCLHRIRLSFLALAVTGLFVGAAGATCEIVGTLTVPGWVALGVDNDGGSIWLTSMPNDGRYDYCLISKFSEATLQMEAQSQEFPWNGRGICHAAGYLWVTDALADVVHVVDATTFEEIRSFPTPGSEPCGITFDGSSLWLTDPAAGTTHQLDLSGNVIGSFSIPDSGRRGLDWHDSLLYTPSDLTTIISYTPDGESNETYVLDCLPAGADICDLAIAPDGAFLYVSNLNRNDGRVYVLSMMPVATEGLSWGELKSIFR